jgi:hypothetical protein
VASNTHIRHVLLVWDFRNQWTSHDDLTEEAVACVFSKTTEKKMMKAKKNLLNDKKFKTALCDLAKKLLMSNFIRGQRHGWILLLIFF